ncbi:MAG: SEC-C metal-binding domain-containing protein [candidate division WOR-3 bacterium]
MALTDIEEKKAEERKREKRLVHFINATVRQFIEASKLKTKSTQTKAEYITKSLLDYVFFHHHKEIGELHEEHIRNFLLEYVPQKLALSKEASKDIPEIIILFLDFLEGEGHIKNSRQLKKVVQDNTKEFIKMLPSGKVSSKKLTNPQEAVVASEIKIGRNDPCPCGSGKKYKKCCGKNK